MIRFTIFPNIKENGSPYIKDFLEALRLERNINIANEAHKNPLISLLRKKNQGDIFIFNWFESIPDFKYGILQTFIAIFLIISIKFRNQKIIWILHNKRPHANGYRHAKILLGKLIARFSDLIITHATDGIEVVKQNYPYALNKTTFLHHPTKNRLSCISKPQQTPIYDLLIWGTITKYKGVIEFVKFLHSHPCMKYKVCIIGKCASTDIYKELTKSLPRGVSFIHEKVSFEELGKYISKTRFVLSPYFSESILSSGILMDSLSFGAKIIGPNTGAFKDYANEPRLKVYNFQSFNDIPNIITEHKDEKISIEEYEDFLNEHNWEHFIKEIIKLSRIN